MRSRLEKPTQPTSSSHLSSFETEKPTKPRMNCLRIHASSATQAMLWMVSHERSHSRVAPEQLVTLEAFNSATRGVIGWWQPCVGSGPPSCHSAAVAPNSHLPPPFRLSVNGRLILESSNVAGTDHYHWHMCAVRACLASWALLLLVYCSTNPLCCCSARGRNPMNLLFAKG